MPTQDADGAGLAASPPAGEQQALFPAEQPALPDPQAGYRGPTACAAAGITYRQLDYWARTGLVEPSIRPAHGSGSQRLYSFRDILVLKVVKKLLDSGISLQNVRTAVCYLRDRGAEDLAGMTLLSDGTGIYECASAEEVVDVLRGGQAVFAVAVAPVVRELGGTLARLPSESPAPAGAGEDELAARRRRRSSA